MDQKIDSVEFLTPFDEQLWMATVSAVCRLDKRDDIKFKLLEEMITLIQSQRPYSK